MASPATPERFALADAEIVAVIDAALSAVGLEG